MKLLLAWAALFAFAIAAPADKLEELKKAFPTHIAGQVTEKSDPAVQKCFNKYRDRVMALTMENLATDLYKIQEAANWEFVDTERRLRNRNNILNSAGRHAEEQNVTWLKQKLIPYLKRLVQFQRGR